MSSHFKIGNIAIGPGKPCLIMAEIAQAHDGSLGMAHAYIDAVAAAGADRFGGHAILHNNLLIILAAADLFNGVRRLPRGRFPVITPRQNRYLHTVVPSVLRN